MYQVRVKIISELENLPEYQTDGACCVDLHASESAEWLAETIGNGLSVNSVIVKTGIRVEIPKGYRMDIYPRSGWGFKHNIQLANGTGKIDSDYVGEILVKLIAIGSAGVLPEVKVGTRIAQMELNKVTKIQWEEVDSIKNTERGGKGFGSTGTQKGQ